MVGIDPASDGLRPRRAPRRPDDRTRASTGSSRCAASTTSRSSSTPPPRRRTWPTRAKLAPYGKQLVDLTPAAIGPYVVPPVNLERAPRRRRATSTWSPAAARPRSRSSPRSRGSPPVPYAEIVASIASQVGRAGHPRQHRRVHRDHRAGDRAGRRRRARQGDHHPQPGRAAADHARHGVLPDRRRRPRRDPRRRSRRWSPRCQDYVPGYRLKQEVQFTAVADGRAGAHPVPDGSARGHHQGDGVPRGRGRGPLPARLRRQPRHHDLGRAAGRRARSLVPATGRSADDPRPTRHPTTSSSTSRTSPCATACTPSGTGSAPTDVGRIVAALDAAGVDAHRGRARRRAGRRQPQLRPRQPHRLGVDRGRRRGHASTPPSPPCCSRASAPSPSSKHAYALGVRSVRVATHCTEADVAAQHIAHGPRARHGRLRLPDDEPHGAAAGARRSRPS